MKIRNGQLAGTEFRYRGKSGMETATVDEGGTVELPEELAKSREKYFKDLDATQRQSQAAKFEEVSGKAAKKYTGAGAYGKISVELGDDSVIPTEGDEEAE